MTTTSSVTPARVRDHRALVRRVCLRVPPLFPLRDMVAVNPFLGYTQATFLAMHAEVSRRLHADVLPDLATFRRLFHEAAFEVMDVLDAACEWNDLTAVAFGWPSVSPASLVSCLDSDKPPKDEPPEPTDRVHSIAARLDQTLDLGLVDAVVSDVASLCAHHLDEGVAVCASPMRSASLFEAFRALSRHDLSMDARGIRGLAALVVSLPEDRDTALAALIDAVAVPESALEDYLGRLLAEVQGWAGVLRYRAYREDHEGVGELPDLLGIRLAYELLLMRSDVARRGISSMGRFFHEGTRVAPSDGLRRDVAQRYVLLCAAERGYRRKLLGRIRDLATCEAVRGRRERPSVQAVFCIDVRSEPLRRALEAEPSVETYGFAGFFGMPIAVADHAHPRGRPQCPVLLAPSHIVRVQPRTRGRLHASARVTGQLFDTLRRSASGGFTFVETHGLGTVLPLLRRTFGSAEDPPHEHEVASFDIEHIDLDTRLDLATSALHNLGLRQPYAQIIVLCAHDASVTNNPQRASLSCGACAGHGGAPNARLLARMLNDRALRPLLAARGFTLADDVLVVAAVHDTTLDEVRILDRDTIPDTHVGAVQALEASLAVAGAATRRERARRLPGMDGAEEDVELARALRTRAADWAEVRPEWSLAGNAAFVAARRERTRGVNLEGRVFLHEYDFARDGDGRVLELLLTAPVVVACWINLGYYGATVAPEVLSSGNKTIHNVTAGIGVVEGFSSDLAVGLSHQAVHDGSRSRHAPIRLQVVVEAETWRIDAVLARHEGPRALVENGYIVLHALEPDGDACRRFVPGAGWCSGI